MSAPRRPRVLVLTQYYHPEPNFVTADVARALARDADVVVVTAHPNYPAGRFAPGTRWWLPRRTREEGGVTVWRLPVLPDRSTSKLRRAASYLSFLFAALLWAPLVAGRPDVVWVYHTPFTTALAALPFRLLHGARLVYTSADLWPESFLATGVARQGPLLRLLFAYSRAINRTAHLLVCATRGTLERYARDGVPAERLLWIPVWTESGMAAGGGSGDGADGRPATPEEAPAGDRIVYAGNLGPAQGLEVVVRAAALLAAEPDPPIFDLYGSGAAEAELRRLAGELGATNVRFHGRVAPQEAFAASSRALAQVVCLRPSPLFAMTVPSKLYACFAAGAPVLYGLQGEAAELARESGGGFAFDPTSPESLAAAVRAVRALPAGERSALRARLRRYYDSQFDPRVLLEQYRALILRAPRAVPADPRPAATPAPRRS